MSTYITKRAKELGLRKVDAKTSLPVTLTKSDIKLGKQKNSKCCAFARACKRMPKVKNAYFFRSAAWLEYDDKIVRYVLPPSIQKEIVSFDRSGVMAPGKYQMSAPGKKSTLRAALARSKKRPGRHQPGAGRIKRKIVHRTSLVRNQLEPVA